MYKLLFIALIATSCRKSAPEQPETFQSLNAKGIDCKTCHLQSGLSATFCYNYCRFLEQLGKGEVK